MKKILKIFLSVHVGLNTNNNLVEIYMYNVPYVEWFNINLVKKLSPK